MQVALGGVKWHQGWWSAGDMVGVPWLLVAQPKGKKMTWCRQHIKIGQATVLKSAGNWRKRCWPMRARAVGNRARGVFA